MGGHETLSADEIIKLVKTKTFAYDPESWNNSLRKSLNNEDLCGEICNQL